MTQPINWAAPEDVRTGTAIPKPEDGERNKASDYPLALQRAAIEIQRLEQERDALQEALTLAEDVLSRSPFSNHMWPNGIHPQIGMEQIRAALGAKL
jgi:hypothetical protein